LRRSATERRTRWRSEAISKLAAVPEVDAAELLRLPPRRADRWCANNASIKI